MKICNCDYCGQPLNCESGSLQDRRYWTLDLGVRVCNSCLPNICDDYPDMEPEKRLAALRLRHAKHWPTGQRVLVEIKKGWIVEAAAATGICINKINATIDVASTQLQSEIIDRAKDEERRFFLLHREGEYLAAMEAGRVLWNTADAMNAMLEVKPDVITGRRAIRQRKKAGFSSGTERAAERAPDWARWQEMADSLWRENPRLSKHAVAVKISEREGVTPRAISGRITRKQLEGNDRIPTK